VTDPRHEQERRLFLAARELSVVERERFLAERCADDLELREAIAELLELDDDSAPLVDVTPAEPGRRVRRAAEDLPSDVLWAGVGRLRAVCTLLPLVLVAMWLIPVAVQGNLRQEFGDVGQWAPPTLAITASLVMLWLVRVLPSPARVLDAGLVYQVLVSFALVGGQYWDGFMDVFTSEIDFDLVGFSVVAPWMLLYSVIVPSRPARALVALSASAVAPVTVYLLATRAGHAPVLGAGQLFYAFVFPHLATIGFAYFAVRVVYGLGRAVGEAREIGAYRLEELLGEGGMGQVWRASHRLLARPAAIKLIRSDVATNDPAAAESLVRRFEQEARATALLRSPNTVELYDFGRTDDGALYYVMELLDGIDLDALVRRHGPLAPGRVVWLAEQACSSLGEAHERGMVHRDIKPANLMVCRQGLECDMLKVLDFGLVRPLGSEAGTAHGYPLEGTPAFMAPEVAAGRREPGDARADLYGLGCGMFWSLTGRTPFEASTTRAMLEAHLHLTPPPPSDVAPGVPAGLDAVVLRCLEKSPDARFATALELRDALRALDDVPRWTAADAAQWWEEVGASVAPADRIDMERGG
jgi:tRNA A-37 threonylcarbamoyl transferase component Bud32